jgi:hypothetical protein
MISTQAKPLTFSARRKLTSLAFSNAFVNLAAFMKVVWRSGATVSLSPTHPRNVCVLIVSETHEIEINLETGTLENVTRL